MFEEIAAGVGGLNACSFVHLTLISMSPVVRHASDQLRGEILPRLAVGGLIVSLGITEPTAGTDTTRIPRRARREGMLERAREDAEPDARPQPVLTQGRFARDPSEFASAKEAGR